MNAATRAFGLLLAVAGGIVFYAAYGYSRNPGMMALGYLIGTVAVMIGLALFITSSRKD